MGSQSFSYTGAWQTFAVPTGVTQFTIALDGGAASGQHPGSVGGTFNCSDTDTLYILLGDAGNAGQGSGTHTRTGGAATFGGGGPGGDGYNAAGGDSGGGYSCIRLNSTSGTIIAVAAGAGGDSGDGGNGGEGGASTGASGSRGTAGPNSITNATGGSQTGPGQGGTSSSGGSFAGGDGSNSVLGRGGTGGDTGGFDGPGGGGGGGGYYPGGGGPGGSSGFAPGGGGAGGSNYVGRLATVTNNTRGGGTFGQGNLTLTWVDPDKPPANPTITVPATSGTRTLATSSYSITATVSDPPFGSTETRLKVLYSTDSTFNSGVKTVFSGYRTTAGSLTVALTSLTTNNRWYVRVYAQGDSGLVSTGYDTTNFFTDYSPNTPTSIQPSGNTLAMTSIAASCVVSDPDGGNVKAYFYYDTDPNFSNPSAKFFTANVTSGLTASTTLTGLSPNTHYYLGVGAQDPQGLNTLQDVVVDFFTNQTPSVTNLAPANNANLDSTIPQTFSWTFNDPGDSQSAASLRYSTDGGTTWTTVTTTTATSYTFAANTFASGSTVLWQVQVTDSPGLTSDWSPATTVVLSKPVVSMSAKASLVPNASLTKISVVPMSAHGALGVTGSLTKAGSVPMSAHATLTVHPLTQLSLPLAIAATAGLHVTPNHIDQGVVPMGAVAELDVDGFNTTPAGLFLAASGGIRFQEVIAEVVIGVSAGMTVLPDTIATRGVVVMGATATMQVEADQEHSETVNFGAQASLNVPNPIVAQQGLVLMAVQAAVVDSAGLSRTIPMVMAARASVAVQGDPEHSASITISRPAAMAISGLVNAISEVAFGAQAEMAVEGFNTVDSGGCEIIVSGGMFVQAEISVDQVVPMAATAGMFATQPQYVFEGPYLVTTDSLGDTISFTLNSYPVPREIGHRVVVTDNGSVTP